MEEEKRAYLEEKNNYEEEIKKIKSEIEAERQKNIAASEQTSTHQKEAENLRRESEAFLARQMDEMQALAEEQRKAGMLLDDGAPPKLNVSLNSPAPKTGPPSFSSYALTLMTIAFLQVSTSRVNAPCPFGRLTDRVYSNRLREYFPTYRQTFRRSATKMRKTLRRHSG